MFIMEEETKYKSKANIRVFGVGGGGNNAIETMKKEGIQGVQFIAVNTDDQALANSSADKKIQLGSKLTKGLGAGANPEIGRRAAVESYEEIVKALQGADMVFITAGMGGGTGTGGTPLVAQAADELGILTVGIVTTPFIFEGRKRMNQAGKGIRELRNHVDTLIVIPNEKLLQSSEKGISLIEAFKLTDNVLLQSVKGIAELVSVPGLINLDFADIKTVMLNKGMALMGRGVSEGTERAKKAVCEAISSPLLDGISIKGATGMIVNITGDSSLSLAEVQEASSVLTKEADSEADIILGTVIDQDMGSKLSVTVIATGFPEKQSTQSENTLSSLKKNMMSELSNKEKQPQKHFEKETVNEELKKEPYLSQKEEISKEAAPVATPVSKETESPVQPQEKNPIKSEPDQKTTDCDLKEETKISMDSNQTGDTNLKNPNQKLSPREILLLKVKEYARNQKEKKESTPIEQQMDMDWKDNSLEENLSSPFESSPDFSKEDIV